MASNTPNLGLYKKNPLTDGKDTFNIETMLNANWDKLDEKVATKEDLAQMDLSDYATDEELQTVAQAVTSYKNDLAYQTAGGTSVAITLITDVLKDGYAKTFIASANNSGAATTINGKPLYKPNTTSAPTLIKGKAYTVWYSLSNDCFFIKASAEGNATVEKVLAGSTFSNDDDVGLIGTMVNRGAVIITPSTINQAILQGFHNGTGYVAGSPNLIESNIKNGVNLFGVIGKAKTVALTAPPLDGPNNGNKQWVNTDVIRRWGGDTNPIYTINVGAPGKIKVIAQFRVNHENFPATITYYNNGKSIASWVCRSTNFDNRQYIFDVNAGDVITITSNTNNSGWWSEGTHCGVIYQDNYESIKLNGGVFSIIY